MPDQNQPTDQNPQLPGTQGTPSDVNIPGPAGSFGSASQPGDFNLPPVITPPQKKGATGKTIATILGILFLVGAVGAGVYLVQQQQTLREKAQESCPPGKIDETGACNPACCGADSECPSGQACNIPNGYCNSGKSCNASTGGGFHQACDPNGSGQCINQPCPNNASSCANTCNSNSDCSTAGASPPPSPAAGGNCPNDPSKSIVKYVKFTCPNGCIQTTEQGVTAWRCYDNRVDSNSPLSLDGACGQVDALSGTSDANFCGYTEYSCDQARCQGGTTTTIEGQCSDVKAYTVSGEPTSPTSRWTLMSTSSLGNLKAGDTVYFAVSGGATNDSTGEGYDRAKFVINNAPSEVTTERPRESGRVPLAKEFYIRYVIPANATSFTIKAQIHHPTLGWSQ